MERAKTWEQLQTHSYRTDNVKPGQIVEGQHLLESIVVPFVVDNKGSQQSLTELSFQDLDEIEPVSGLRWFGFGRKYTLNYFEDVNEKVI